MGSLGKQTLPTINISKESLEVGSSSWLSTSKEVVLALEEFGCFVATYANFSPDLHHAIFKASKEMFDLPTERLDNPSTGYSKKDPTIALYEALGIENATTQEEVDKFINVLWPSGNDFIRDTALQYSKVMAELKQVVMRMVSEVYGITKSYESLLESTTYRLRLLKYRAPTKDETNLGFIPHKDRSFMTILQQFELKGLQFEAKNGDYITVDPSPSSFVVLAGDICMGWTNGRIESPFHKVVIDHDSEERYSIGMFTFIKDVDVQVPEELVDEDHPLQFKPFNNDKYLQFLYTPQPNKPDCPLRAYCGLNY